MKLFVIAKPGAKIEKVAQLNATHYAVSVKAPAKEGKANKAIELALAKHLGLKPYEVEIIAGHMAKSKVVEIAE